MSINGKMEYKLQEIIMIQYFKLYLNDTLSNVSLTFI